MQSGNESQDVKESKNGEFSSRIPWLWQLIIVIAVFSLPLARAGFTNALFGDDTSFFRQASESQLQSIIFTHAGYMQLLCRSAALFCVQLPDPLCIAMFSIIPLLSPTLVAFAILNFTWINPHKRIFLALLTTFLPHSSEVYAHLCNANWTASLLICILLFQPVLPTLKSKRAIFSIAFTTIMGLSSVYVAILSPLFGIRFLRLKKKTVAELFLIGVIGITSAIQTIAVLSNGLTMNATNNTTPAFPPLFNPIITWINALFVLPAASYFTNSELLQKAVHDIRFFIPTVILLTLTSASVLFLWLKSDRNARWRSLTFFALGYYLILACAPRCADAPQCYLPMRGGERYFYLPYYFFTVALSEILTFKSTAKRIVSCWLVFVLTAFFIHEWKIHRMSEEDIITWNEQLSKLKATGDWDFDPRNGVLPANPSHKVESVK